MPSTSKKQHNFMAMSASVQGRAWLKAHGRKPASAKVAEEFLAEDKKKKKKKKRS